ncbi:MAG: hypothetical protein HOB38_03540, partial [Deltaproteobacteria bacterium]|nr:hypothetical protein [Deltaproteobacteria bacterium]
MKRLSIAAISVRFIFVLGFVVWAFQISLSVAFGAEKLSESYQSLEFDEAEGEETSSLLPESMILVWDINYTIYAHRQDHLLNPEKTFFSFDHRKALTSLDLEWTPKLSESLSLRTREVLEYISLDRKSDIGITLLEGYFEWKNRHQDVIVDIGKIKLEWGSGYAWRPTQVLFEGDNSVDTDKESAAGVEMALLEFVIKNTTNTLLVAGMKDEDDSGNNNQLQAAYRISLESQSWELSLLYHKTSDAVITTG